MRAAKRTALFLLAAGCIALPPGAGAQLNADATSVWVTAGIGGSFAGNPSTRVAGWIGLSRFVVGVVQSAEEPIGWGGSSFERHAKAVLIGLRTNRPGRRLVVVTVGVANVVGSNDGGPAGECFLFCTNMAVPVADPAAPVLNIEIDRGFSIVGGSWSFIAVGGDARHAAMTVSFRVGASGR